MAHSTWYANNEARAKRLFEELLLDGHPWDTAELLDVVTDRMGYPCAGPSVIDVFWGQIAASKKYTLDGLETIMMPLDQEYDQQIELMLEFGLSRRSYSPERLIEIVADDFDGDTDRVWAALMRLKNRGEIDFKTIVVKKKAK